EDADDAFRKRKQENDRGTSTFRDALVRLGRNKGSVVGLLLIVLIIFFAIFGPMMNSHDFREQDLSRANLPPKASLLSSVPFIGFDGIDIKGNDQYEAKNIEENFWFGTDDLGRDVWSRVWQGTRISLYIAFLAAALDLL